VAGLPGLQLQPASGGGNRPPASTALAGAGEPPSAEQLRAMMISEFCDWLRSRTNKHKRPYQAETITAYKVAARALGAWMTSQRIEDDFTACDTPLLNRFFRDYQAAHGQSGTNTKQRNLRHLFTWLEDEYGHPHPYTPRLNRYAPVTGRPSTLSVQFITDLLDVTGNGKARNFEDARDFALIRVLCEGVRRTEITQMRLTDLPADLVAQPLIRVVPLKGARAEEEGRLIPLSAAAARAIAAYLRQRKHHKHADSPALWLGLRNHGPMTGWGLYRMLQRRADKAGYDPKEIHPHQFRHTFANDWRSNGGSEGDLMRLMGWRTRAMLDRYGADMADQRAFDAKRKMGDLY
jgi:site-specific recombinase XerD